MLISKADALAWFTFFAELPDDEPLLPRQQEIALATLSQIELAEEARIEKLPVGHGPERRAQDQPLQPPMPLLL